MAATKLALTLAVTVLCCSTALPQEQSMTDEQARDAARDREAKRHAEGVLKQESQRNLQNPIYRYPDHQQFFSEGAQLEREGNARQAVKAYVSAARAGSVHAAVRLAEIYQTGIPGVPRDPTESVKWTNLARKMREDVAKPRMKQ